MILSTVSIDRLYSIVSTGAGSRGILFRVKAVSFRVPTLYRSIAVFIAFKILINSSTADSSTNSSCFILLEELISINNYISIYGRSKFHH